MQGSFHGREPLGTGLRSCPHGVYIVESIIGTFCANVRIVELREEVVMVRISPRVLVRAKTYWQCVLCLILSLSWPLQAAVQSTQPSRTSTEIVPLEAFAKLPAYDDISLSPDGNQAVALQASGGTYHVVLLDFKAGSVKLLMAADPENFLFNWCRFANKTRIICSIRSYIILQAGTISLGSRYYRDGRTVVTRLLAIDVDGKNQIQLIPESKSRMGGTLEWNTRIQDKVVSWLPRDPKHILVQLAREDRRYPSVYKLNIDTNKLDRQQTYRTDISTWYADDQGRIRFATGLDSKGDPLAHSWASGKRVKVDVSHLGEPAPLHLAADNKSLYVLANRDKSNTRGLHRVDLANAQIIETLLEDQSFDINWTWTHRTTRQILFAGYIEAGEQYTWFDKEFEQAVDEARKKLGTPTFLDIKSATRNLSHLILHAHGNGIASTFYRFDVAEKSLMKLAATDMITPVSFEYVSYPARDGTSIPAYLALPGPKDQGPYPTIVDPHGGPWAKDHGRIDFLTQYFLHRGYAVLKPNFRGSDGYGKAYLEAGFSEWGGVMQNDVIDGLDWMIEQKLADPKNTCIHGASYGGYVALVAAYKTPDKFNCAISFAGVTDLAALRERLYNFNLGRLTAARLPKGAALIKNSPIENVKKMGIPLLIVHGDVDRSVMIEQSRDLVSGLKKAKKDYIYIEQTNGDHFFSLESHRLEYLQALDEFLDQHLGR